MSTASLLADAPPCSDSLQPPSSPPLPPSSAPVDASTGPSPVFETDSTLSLAPCTDPLVPTTHPPPENLVPSSPPPCPEGPYLTGSLGPGSEQDDDDDHPIFDPVSHSLFLPLSSPPPAPISLNPEESSLALSMDSLRPEDRQETFIMLPSSPGMIPNQSCVEEEPPILNPPPPTSSLPSTPTNKRSREAFSLSEMLNSSAPPSIYSSPSRPDADTLRSLTLPSSPSRPTHPWPSSPPRKRKLGPTSPSRKSKPKTSSLSSSSSSKSASSALRDSVKPCALFSNQPPSLTVPPTQDTVAVDPPSKSRPGRMNPRPSTSLPTIAMPRGPSPVPLEGDDEARKCTQLRRAQTEQAPGDTVYIRPSSPHRRKKTRVSVSDQPITSIHPELDEKEKDEKVKMEDPTDQDPSAPTTPRPSLSRSSSRLISSQPQSSMTSIITGQTEELTPRGRFIRDAYLLKLDGNSRPLDIIASQGENPFHRNDIDD